MTGLSGVLTASSISGTGYGRTAKGRSGHVVGLPLWRRQPEGLKLGTCRIDADDSWKSAFIATKMACIEQLRHQTQLGQWRLVAVAEKTGSRLLDRKRVG